MGKEKDSTSTELVTAPGMALSTKEQKLLGELENVITNALKSADKSVLQMASAFSQIKDGKLYRATEDSRNPGRMHTWETYCPDVWGFTADYVNKIIRASGARAILEANTTVLAPPTEGVIRELAPILTRVRDEDASTQAKAALKMAGLWEQAVEEHGAPTAKQVKELRENLEAEEAFAAALRDALEGDEIIVDAEVIEPGNDQPAAPPRAPNKSSLLASVTRAVNAALDGGVTLEEIVDSIQRTRDARDS